MPSSTRTAIDEENDYNLTSNEEPELSEPQLLSSLNVPGDVTELKVIGSSFLFQLIGLMVIIIIIIIISRSWTGLPIYSQYYVWEELFDSVHLSSLL